MTAVPTVSVVIPAYRKGPYLKEVIAALLQQSVEVLEVVVSHSSSNDPTHRLTTLSEKVKVLHSEEPLYAGAARNRGVDVISGDWVAFFDEDVVPDRHCIEQFLAASRRYPEVSAFIGSVDVASTGGYWGMCMWHIEFGSQHPLGRERPVDAMAGCINFISANAFRQVGGFSEVQRIGEDADLHKRIRYATGPLMFIPLAKGSHHNLPGYIYFRNHLRPLGKGAADVRKHTLLVRHPQLTHLLPVARLALFLARAWPPFRGRFRGIAPYLPGIIVGLSIWATAFRERAIELHSEDRDGENQSTGLN